MKRLQIVFGFIVLLLAISCKSEVSQSVDNIGAVSSPDGSIELSIGLSQEGSVFYNVTAFGHEIVDNSLLGFSLRGGRTEPQYRFERLNKANLYDLKDFSKGFTVVGQSTDSKDDTWTPVWGEEESIREHYNELLLNLRQESTGRLMDIRIRAFDDGIGFRYEFPAQQGLKFFVVNEELTQFNMTDDNIAWWIPVDFDSQEYEYSNTHLSEVKDIFAQRVKGNVDKPLQGVVGVQTALIMKTPDSLYVTLHEAALKDYSCMHLKVDGHKLSTMLTPDAEGWKAHLQAPCVTPWRTIQIARKATDMLQSRLVLNLNEPCAYEDVSWIHPVKYIGVWWEMISGRGEWHYTNDFPTVTVG